MSVPQFTLALKSIESLNDSTEVGNDEPYLLVVGVDFTNPALFEIGTTLYGPFSLGKSETATTLSMPFGTPAAVYDIMDTRPGVVRRPFWGVNSNMPTSAFDINRLNFVMVMMENDDGDPELNRSLLHGAAFNAVHELIKNQLFPPNGRKKNELINPIINAIKELRGTGFLDGGLNNDDFVMMQPLMLDEQDFKLPLAGRRDLMHRPSFSNPSGTEGRFRVTMELAFS